MDPFPAFQCVNHVPGPSAFQRVTLKARNGSGDEAIIITNYLTLNWKEDISHLVTHRAIFNSMQQLEFVNYQPSLSLSIEKGTPQNVQSVSVQIRPQRVSTVLNLIESMKKKFLF